MCVNETREQILARFSDDEKAQSGRESVDWDNPDWILFEFVSGDLVCPQCGHACGKEFYSCGDDSCCYSHCVCECMWGANMLNGEIVADLYEFIETSPRRWRVSGMVK